MKQLVILSNTLEGDKLTKGSRKTIMKTKERNWKKMKMIRVYQDDNGKPYLVPTYKYIKHEDYDLPTGEPDNKL